MVRITIKYFKILLVLAGYFTGNTCSYAQDSASTINNESLSPQIKFVSQLSSGDTTNAQKHKNIFDLITGKRKPKLVRPVSMIENGDNSFWILDQNNSSVFQFTKDQLKAVQFINKSKQNLSSIVGICNYDNDRFLFTDSYLNKIFLVDPSKKKCIPFNNSLQLNKPTGIAYSEVKKEVWVLETGAHRIIILNENGDPIKTIGTRGKERGEFNFPTHIWIDKTGNAYVVDAMNFRVQVFNQDGEVISVFGSNGDATGYFASPKGIATDSYGHIYVSDALFHSVQIFDIKGNFLYSFGTQGQDEGQFWMPSGIFIDKKNKIYVSDTYNSRIEIFQLVMGNSK